MSIESFFDWLKDKNYVIADGNEVDRNGYLEPVRRSDEQLIFEFLDIDPVKLEAERAAMLEELQEQARG